MAKILISGGNGMLGRYISSLLTKRGHKVQWLSRQVQKVENFQCFVWDPANRKVDPRAFDGVQHLLHFSGSNIGETAWTEKNKKNIRDSRVCSAEFLHECYKNYGFPLQSFTGASAIGYYGSQPVDELMKEDHPPGSDFLSKVCVDWEKAYQPFKNSGVRTNTIRLGIVLSTHGGLYAKLRPVFSSGFGAVAGNGRNFIPWIHEKDASELFCRVIEDNAFSGVYNAVSSEVPMASDFYKVLAESFGKKIWLPSIPDLVFKLILGERSMLVLGGRKVSNSKLLKSGFQFHFNNLREALKDLQNQ